MVAGFVTIMPVLEVILVVQLSSVISRIPSLSSSISITSGTPSLSVSIHKFRLLAMAYCE